jgi:outer membrane protein W
MVIVLYQEWSWNMKNLKRVILLFVVSALLSLSAQSQDPAMKGRSGIELDCGLWTGPNASTAVGMEGIGVDVTSNAFVGGILFTHWVQEYLSITVSAGLLEGKASSTVSFLSVTQHVSSVVPVLLGVRYYVLGSTADGQVRPYLSAAVGPYIGSEVNNTILAQESHTETAFGGRVGGGIDFFFSDHFKLGANTGYHIMSDFSTSIGARKNYNGGDFSIGLGYML